MSVSFISWLVDSVFSSSSIFFVTSSISLTSMSEFRRFESFGDVGSTSSRLLRRQFNLFKRLFQPTKNITSMKKQNWLVLKFGREAVFSCYRFTYRKSLRCWCWFCIDSVRDQGMTFLIFELQQTAKSHPLSSLYCLLVDIFA